MKGISPLIASVLLIAFTVAVATIVMGWFTTFTRDTTSNVSSQTEEVVGCSSGGIKIVHVYNGTIIAENTGFKDFSTVNGMIVNSTGASCNNTASITLNKGAINSLSLTGCPDVDSSSFDRAVLTTECGGVGDSTTDSSDFG